MDNKVSSKPGRVLDMLQRNNKNNKKSTVTLLVLAFVVIQTYALYASTSHVFHDSMPMCPVCVAIKSYEHSVVNTAIGFYDNSVAVLIEPDDSVQVFRPNKSYTQSRAPPLV